MYANVYGMHIIHLTNLTLQTVCIQQILALLMAFDSTLRAAHPLSRNTPKQTLTFIAVSGSCGCPHFKIVGSCGGNGID